jgi:hypothetical protein
MTEPKQEEYSLEGLEILNDIPKKPQKKRTLKTVLRNSKIDFRVDDDERATIISNAKNSGMTVASFVRGRAIDKIITTTKNDKNEVNNELISIQKTLLSIDNNLNQLTRYSHQTGKFDERIYDVLTTLKKILR